MNDVKLLHAKCWFFQFFNNPVTWKNKKKILPPPRKSWNDASVPIHSLGSASADQGIGIASVS